MKLHNAVLGIALGVALCGAASAQVISYSPRTGDIWVDTQLGQMNDYGRQDRDYFIDDVVNNFGAPRYLVNDLLTTRRWSPGDVYYACAMAYQLRRPCGDVAKAYEQDRGQGWGAVAKRMGIKPGSAQFHAMKGQVGKSNGKFKSGKRDSSAGDGYRDEVTRSQLHAPSGKSDKGYKGKSGEQGHSDKGKGKDKGKKGN